MSRPRSPRGKSSSWKRVIAKLRWWAVQLKAAVGLGRPRTAPVTVRAPDGSKRGPSGSTGSRRDGLPRGWDSGNVWALLIVTTAVLSASTASAADDYETQLEQTIRAAVERVAPSVVRIETVGGRDAIRSGQQRVNLNNGPTTGLAISADGYIISSAFNFLQKPTSILVGLPDGTRAPAKLIATDYNRKLALLKVDAEGLKLSLVPAVPAPESEIKVGQTAIAIGRTFDGGAPAVSIGIVSALGRIWGRAIQTDSKVSPSNYGGPLIDLEGRVLGVLAPLSHESDEDTAGVEWYDSGIGFAVPLEHVLKIQPRLAEGQDLFSGVMGVGFKGDGLAAEPIIGLVRAGSPAAEAELKAGDKIVQLAGKPTERVTQVKHALGPHYAGDVVALVVERDGQKLEKQLKLAAKLEPYVMPQLGVLPLRDPPAADAPGVPVRAVLAGSAAEKAGVKAGDVIVSVGADPVKDRAQLRSSVYGHKVNETVKIALLRDGQRIELNTTLTPIAEKIPAVLPAAHAARPAFAGDRPAVGALLDQKVVEFPNVYMAYVPETYDPALSYGVLVVFHEPGKFQPEVLLAQWKPICDAHDLILLAPRGTQGDKWLNTEIDFVEKMFEDVRGRYTLDPSRFAFYGRGAGAAMAFLTAGRKRDLVRGLAIVEMPPVGGLNGENEPTHPLSFFIAWAPKSQLAAAWQAGVQALRTAKFPVVTKEMGPENPRDLNAEELSELVRWIDSLDAI